MFNSHKISIEPTNELVGTGWIPPIFDPRDYTEEHPEIKKLTNKLKMPSTPAAIPPSIDLRIWCSPVENQETLGSCTAHAVVGIVEYYEKKAFGNHLEGSRLFVYKTTRNLLGLLGDTGAWIKYTMGAIALCGVAPEKYWPYTDNRNPGPAGDQRHFDMEPTNFVYALADNYETLSYFCHDPLSAPPSPAQVLASVKNYLAMRIPSAFGFWVFQSYNQADVKGAFPFPGPDEDKIAGHAVMAVGYDDNLKIKNKATGKVTTGALMIRNSWGTTWGDNGYGWLPYEYVLTRNALDFWSLIGMRWVDMKIFGLDA